MFMGIPPNKLALLMFIYRHKESLPGEALFVLIE